MRKTIFALILSFICLFLSGCAMLDIFQDKGQKKMVAERLGVDLSSAQVLDEWEYRGWFGDGEAFVKLSVPDGFEEKLGLVEIAEGKFEGGWHTLPLTDIAYQYYYEWGGLFEHPETGEKVIPEVENGYWKLMSDGPANWTLVILDTDADILYYYEYDS